MQLCLTAISHFGIGQRDCNCISFPRNVARALLTILLDLFLFFLFLLFFCRLRQCLPAGSAPQSLLLVDIVARALKNM